MAHEVDKERLSAFIDGELDAAQSAAVRTHLAACAECAAYLERVTVAAADFKKHGKEAVPSAVMAAALAQARAKKDQPKPQPFYKLLVALTAAIFLVLAGSLIAKRFAPGLFGQLQGMISGAAGNLGQ